MQPSKPGLFGLKRLLRKVKKLDAAGERGSLFSSTDILSMLLPRVWDKAGGFSALSRLGPCIDNYLGGSGDGSCSIISREASQVEAEIADGLRSDGPAEARASAALRLDAVVCAVPDVLLYPAYWRATSERLASCPLLQHAKVIPHSLAAMQYLVNSNAWLPLAPPGSACHALVLSCGDWLVECTLHTLRAASPGYIEAAGYGGLYMAELAG